VHSFRTTQVQFVVDAQRRRVAGTFNARDLMPLVELVAQDRSHYGRREQSENKQQRQQTHREGVE
jgi:hypothetical protein